MENGTNDFLLIVFDGVNVQVYVFSAIAENLTTYRIGFLDLESVPFSLSKHVENGTCLI